MSQREPGRAPARGRAVARPVDRPGAIVVPTGVGLVGWGDAARARLGGWLAAELSPGRLFAWLPVCFGAGIVLYFAAETEPAMWAAALAFAGALALAVVIRRTGVPVLAALALLALTAGFLTATLRAHLVAAPVLTRTLYAAELSGFVEAREERDKTDRIVLRVHALAGVPEEARPARVRVAVRKGTSPPIGTFVALKARLSPPLSPLRPGGYDFARDLYFQRIGATGFALGAIRIEAAPVATGWRAAASGTIDGIREAIDQRIRTSLTGDAGAIASALITGKRDAVSAPVEDAMYVSSLAHVLSISGYHMAVVAGIVFVGLRAGLALVPGLALTRPIKAWAAWAALVATAFYLVLSGAEVATQRAFVMTAIVLVGAS